MPRLSVFTNSTFILLCLNVHTKEFAQKLCNIPFGVHARMNWLRGYAIQLSLFVGSPDSLGPEPTWRPYKVPVLRLPPQPRAFRHHAFANVVQHLQRLYGLVVIEAVGELSQAGSPSHILLSTNITTAANR